MTDYPVPSLKESIEAIEKSYDAKLRLKNARLTSARRKRGFSAMPSTLCTDIFNTRANRFLRIPQITKIY